MPADNSEGLSHKELHALVSGARPNDLSTRSDAVSVAARKIYSIVQDLERLVKKAEWEGESGEALRTWTKNFAKEGRALGDYATLVGSALFFASDGLSYAKKTMPEVKDGSQSEKDRQDALRVITRLNSYYSEAAKDVASPTRPNFPLLVVEDLPAPSPETPRKPIPGGVDRTSDQAGRNLSNNFGITEPEDGSERSNSRGGPADSQVQTELDSAGVVTDPRSASPSHAPTGTTGASPGPVAGTGPVGPVGGAPGLGAGRNTAPGAIGGPGAAGVPRQPAVAVARPGVLPAGSNGTGIHGGTARPVSAGPSPAGMPRGTVIGGQAPTTAGNAPTRGPVNGLMGGPAGRSPQAAGRAPGASGAAVGIGRGSAAPRGSAGMGAPPSQVAHGTRQTNRSTRRVRDESEPRPDYLTEEEETWYAGRRRTVPPVIDN